MPEHVGMVGLGEAGNLGDDLILIAAAASLDEAVPGVRIDYLSFSQHLDWNALKARLNLTCVPNPILVRRGLPGRSWARRLFSRHDGVVFGGGGLLQTTHHPERPYHWLQYVSDHIGSVPVVAVGLGLGPLSTRWRRRLARAPMPFDECYLRDDESLHLAQAEFDWPARRCRDFVDGTFLAALLNRPGDAPSEIREDDMGVALRAWPGWSPDDAAAHVDRIANANDADTLSFYVLEAKNRTGPDHSFAESVAARVSRRTNIEVYCGRNILDFLGGMTACRTAVSMKLHSSAIWAAAGAKLYPVVYAPKIASFFNLPYHGLQVFEQSFPAAIDEERVPRAQDVVHAWARARGTRGANKARGGVRVWSNAQHFKLQASSFAHDVTHRLSSSIFQGRGEN